jgi:hypothetical protein
MIYKEVKCPLHFDIFGRKKSTLKDVWNDVKTSTDIKKIDGDSVRKAAL